MRVQQYWTLRGQKRAPIVAAMTAASRQVSDEGAAAERLALKRTAAQKRCAA